MLMNRFNYHTSLLIFGLVLLMALPATAQRRGRQLSPQQRAELRTGWLNRQLALSGEQAEKVQQINLSLAQSVEKLEGEYPRMEAFREQRRELMRNHMREIRSLLTTEQQQRIREHVLNRSKNEEGGNRRREALRARQEALRELELSEEQRSEMARYRDELKAQLKELRVEYEAVKPYRQKRRQIAKTHRQQLMDVLTDEQRQQLKQLRESGEWRGQQRNAMQDLYPEKEANIPTLSAPEGE